MKRPTTHLGSTCTTPSSATVIRLLDGKRHGNVTYSSDEMRYVARLYGMDIDAAAKEAQEEAEAAYKKHLSAYEETQKKVTSAARRSYTLYDDDWRKPQPPNLQEVAAWATAGALRNLWRHAEVDGLRLLGVIAKFVERGEDPVKLLVHLLMEAGFDVATDPEWVYGEGEEGEEEEEASEEEEE